MDKFIEYFIKLTLKNIGILYLVFEAFIWDIYVLFKDGDFNLFKLFYQRNFRDSHVVLINYI